VARQLWSDDDDVRFRASTEAALNKLLAEVEQLPPPDHATMFQDVYADQPWNLREQQAALEAELRRRAERPPHD
jgi:pyruvate dehydrogenase E1 component alpha subunit